MSGLYFIKGFVDYSERSSIVRDNLPKYFHGMFFNSGASINNIRSENHRFIIGTSHVWTGFNECVNKRISQIFEPSMTGEVSIIRANALMSDALLNNVNNVNLILEVTLIEWDRAQSGKQITFLSGYVLEALPIIYNAIVVKVGKYDINCDKQHDRQFDEKQLAISIEESKRLDSLNVDSLFFNYKKNLTTLIKVCESTKNSRVTLVSLPIHPDLYAIENVRNSFQTLESNINAYLSKVANTHSCDISYLNLVTLGAEFPEQKFWSDPGHFLPEVGEQVLKEIELFHAAKQLN